MAEVTLAADVEVFRRRVAVLGVIYLGVAALLAVALTLTLGYMSSGEPLGVLPTLIIGVLGGAFCGAASLGMPPLLAKMRMSDSAVIGVYLHLDELRDLPSGDRIRSMCITESFGLMFSAIPLFLAAVIWILMGPLWLVGALTIEALLLACVAYPTRARWRAVAADFG